MKVQYNLKIYGTVQGVFYRANARDRAEELKLTGWVKNNIAGTVEMCLQGDQKAVDEMVDWCYEGPPGSDVEEIKVDKKTLRADEELGTFEIRY